MRHNETDHQFCHVLDADPQRGENEKQSFIKLNIEYRMN